MMHIFKKRCEECRQTYLTRRPTSQIRFVKAIQIAVCPNCHPEALKDVCDSCRLPYTLVGHHADGMCMACYGALRRYKRSQNVRV